MPLARSTLLRAFTSAVPVLPDTWWATESVKAGVVLAVSMETNTLIATPGFPIDADTALLNNSEAQYITFDTSVKASGAAGSWKITQPNQLEDAAGDIGLFFDPPARPGETKWFFIRRRGDKADAYQPVAVGTNTGKKWMIISHFQETSTIDEIVPFQITGQTNHAEGYNQSGGTDPSGTFPPWDETYNVSDKRRQPIVDNADPNKAVDSFGILTGVNPDNGAAWTTQQLDAARYGSLFSSLSESRFRKGYGDPLAKGFRIVPDEFIAVLVRVHYGQRGQPRTRVTMWGARENQTFKKLVDKKTIYLGNSIRGTGVDTFFFNAYCTNRSDGGRQVVSIGSTIGGISVPICGLGTPLNIGKIRYDSSAAFGQWSYKSAIDNYGTARGHSVSNNILKLNLSSSLDGGTTTLANNISFISGTPISVTLIDGTICPTTGGTLIVGIPDTTNTSTNGEQRLNYTSRSGNTLLGCTTPDHSGTGDHAAGDPVKFDSYVLLSIDNANALPASGTGVYETDVTIGEGRPTQNCWYNHAIISRGPIWGPSGVPPTDPENSLANIALAMTAGTWVEITGINQATMASTLGQNTGVGTGSTVTQANFCAWSALDDSLHLVGHPHGTSIQRYVKFDTASKTWSIVDSSSSLAGGGVGHPYDHNVLNTINGDHYFRQNIAGGPITIWSRTHGTTTFSVLPTFAFSGFTQPTMGVTFWSGPMTYAGGLGALGGIVVYNGGTSNDTNDANNGFIHIFDVSANTWKTQIAGAMPFSFNAGNAIENVAQYSQKYNCVVFGGGTNAATRLRKMDLAGAFTEMPTIPNQLGTGTGLDGTNVGRLWCEPVTGKFLVMGTPLNALGVALQLHELDPTGSGIWRQLTGNSAPPSGLTSTVSAGGGGCGIMVSPIPEWGVTIVTKQRTYVADGRMWLFKHQDA